MNHLGQLQPGAKAEIIGFEQPPTEFEGFLRRLYEVGFLVGSQLEILQDAPYSHDPISVRIKEATYALRRAEANLIQVKICE
jgi:Fe2+ transport system protein FeoA